MPRTSSKKSSTTRKAKSSSSESEETVVQCENFAISWSQGCVPSSWIIDQPQFKFCKKRKEFFSNEYEQIWYKSPYKYNMRMKVTSAVPCLSDTLITKLNVTHEDGSVVKSKTETISFSAPTSPKRKNGKKNASSSSDHSSDSESEEEMVQNKPKTPTCHHEVKLGPFQFNVCSYKYDGKKFRLMIHLFHEDKEICCLTSPAFLIKAKKPIAKPGIKSKKRSHEEMTKKSEVSPKSSKASVVQPEMTPVIHGLPQMHMPMPFNPYQMTPDSLDMQKKLVEEQLFQFGCMLNNIVSNVYQNVPVGSFKQEEELSQEPSNKRRRVAAPVEFPTTNVMQAMPTQEIQYYSDNNVFGQFDESLIHSELPMMGHSEQDNQSSMEYLMKEYEIDTSDNLLDIVKSEDFEFDLSHQQAILTDNLFFL